MSIKKYLLDTNILIDYYLCSNNEDFSEGNMGFCRSFKGFMDYVLSAELLMSDVSIREFVLKLIHKMAITPLPPPDNLGKSLVTYADNLVNQLINELNVNVLDTDKNTLRTIYELAQLIRGMQRRKLKKRILRGLDRDAINIVHAGYNEATLLTEDENLIYALMNIPTDVLNISCKPHNGFDFKINNCHMIAHLTTSGSSLNASVLLISPQQ